VIVVGEEMADMFAVFSLAGLFPVMVLATLVIARIIQTSLMASLMKFVGMMNCYRIFKSKGEDLRRDAILTVDTNRTGAAGCIRFIALGCRKARRES
jgi:hypothetical protein